MEKEFDYKQEESDVFGQVKRPRVEMQIYSKKKNLKIKLADREFATPIAIADSDDVPSIFGRVNGLDLFDANFLQGEKIELQWEH